MPYITQALARLNIHNFIDFLSHFYAFLVFSKDSKIDLLDGASVVKKKLNKVS